MRNSVHTQEGIISPKLDKLWRRKQATEEVDRKVTLEWLDYAEVEKSLDNWLKAHGEYWDELVRVRRRV